MLAEREEALGKSHSWPDLGHSQWALVYLSLSVGGVGMGASQKLTALAPGVFVVTWRPGVVLRYV